METKIQKWGNSLALRIPKSFAAHVHFEQNTSVNISVEQDKLIIKPSVQEPSLKKAEMLEHLLAEITDDNLHNEVQTGASVGREIW
jgi:antitoxin MazE